MAQCREGWHLAEEPNLTSEPPSEDHQPLLELRADLVIAYQEASRLGAGEADELRDEVRSVDEELRQLGMRGRLPSPDGPTNRPVKRSTRRRQDAPELPRRRVEARTLGREYAGRFQPSMFVTLTCDSYGRVREDGTPVNPAGYDYRRVRVMEQAVRDGLTDRNPAQVTGWQHEYKRAEDELDDPRALALSDWHTLTRLADALVAKSSGQYRGWGDVVLFAACTAARIGEVSGCRVKDIDTSEWTWNVRRQTTPSPGGLVDKGTKGKRARTVPLIEEIRELVQQRMAAVDREPDARLFTGPRGGRISTAVLRDATSWDEVVGQLGYEHLRRHDLRHTGLTWMADAGVPVHHLRLIAGHGSLSTTQRYLHPDRQSVTDAGELLSKHLRAPRRGNLRAVR